MDFVPRIIVLDTGAVVRLFHEYISHLNIPPNEISELINFIVSIISYKDEELYLQQCNTILNDLIDSYRDNFSQEDTDRFEFALRELVRHLREHFLSSGIYNYDGFSSPYHFEKMLADGSIVIEFDHTDSEIKW